MTKRRISGDGNCVYSEYKTVKIISLFDTINGLHISLTNDYFGVSGYLH